MCSRKGRSFWTGDGRNFANEFEARQNTFSSTPLPPPPPISMLVFGRPALGGAFDIRIFRKRAAHGADSIDMGGRGASLRFWLILFLLLPSPCSLPTPTVCEISSIISSCDRFAVPASSTPFLLVSSFRLSSFLNLWEQVLLCTALSFAHSRASCARPSVQRPEETGGLD